MRKLLALLLPALMAAWLVACCRSTTKQDKQSLKTMQAQKTARLDCLPEDIRLEQVVSYGKRNVTVEETLDAMKAWCENGKLLDQNKKEIRFFRVACFGNPPYNYDEIRQREQEEIARLQESFTVIVIECDPMIQ
jgi:hypothetical protein